mmetsp:Transcript_19063/g.24614  ORF Transcript_19063/g.24614 Transcript_19063/m.24614 type:complete len:234 (+) Transcript_19063:67-768(+)
MALNKKLEFSIFLDSLRTHLSEGKKRWRKDYDIVSREPEKVWGSSYILILFDKSVLSITCFGMENGEGGKGNIWELQLNEDRLHQYRNEELCLESSVSDFAGYFARSLKELKLMVNDDSLDVLIMEMPFHEAELVGSLELPLLQEKVAPRVFEIMKKHLQVEEASKEMNSPGGDGKGKIRPASQNTPTSAKKRPKAGGNVWLPNQRGRGRGRAGRGGRGRRGSGVSLKISSQI